MTAGVLRPKKRAAALLIAVSFVLTSCHQGSPVEPAEAKQAIVTMVDRSTAALGGEWTVMSGPGLDTCTRYNGDEGVRYVYIVERPATDPPTDIATVEALWQDRGITTERYQSGGDDPTLGIRGAGGPASSMDFDASVHGYFLRGVSECADGNYVTMARNEP